MSEEKVRNFFVPHPDEINTKISFGKSPKTRVTIEGQEHGEHYFGGHGGQGRQKNGLTKRPHT